MTKLTEKEIEFKNLLIEFLYDNAFKNQIDVSDEEAIEFIEKLSEKGITIDENRKKESLPTSEWELLHENFIKNYWEGVMLKEQEKYQEEEFLRIRVNDEMRAFPLNPFPHPALLQSLMEAISPYFPESDNDILLRTPYAVHGYQSSNDDKS